MNAAATAAVPRRWVRAWAVVSMLVCASLLVSCGSGADEAAIDATGQLVCPDLPEAAEPLPQIYVLDLEDPQVLAEVYDIEDAVLLSIVRRDVVDRSPAHFGWHRGGVVAPVRVWSTVFGVDPQQLMPPVAVDGLATTDDPCELQRFDALAGFYDYIAVEGSGVDGRRFDVVGASDDFLTEFLGQSQPVGVDETAVAALLDDFGDERSVWTNRRYVVLAAAGLTVLAVLWWLGQFGRRTTRRSRRT